MSIFEQGISLSGVRRVRESTYQLHGEEKPYATYKDVDGYRDNLPKFNGRNLTEIIEDKISQGSDCVRVLDVGCGEGIFLANLIRRYPQVRAFGISSFDYRPRAERAWSEYVNQIDYRTGDAHKLNAIFSGVEFDLTVSYHCVEYLSDPLAVLKQIYRRSKTGGIILLDRLGVSLSMQEANQLSQYWKQHETQAELTRWAPSSYDPSIYSLSLQRGTNPRLPLPFRYRRPVPIEIVDPANTANPFGWHMRYALTGKPFSEN